MTAPLSHPHPNTPISQIFPTLCNITSLEDLLEHARLYLPLLAPAVAAQHALSSGAATDWNRRVNKALIEDHTQSVMTHGLLYTLSTMATQLRNTGSTLQLQPTPLPGPPRCQAQLDTVPPPPMVRHIAATIQQLAMGTAGPNIPATFVPSHPAQPLHTSTDSLITKHTEHKPSSIAGLDLAMELLVAKDQLNGKTIIVTETTLLDAARSDGIDVNINEAFIVRKRDAATGRLVAHYTRSGLNTDTLAADLEKRYGSIKLPTIADVCAMIKRVADAFPGQALGLLKMDYSDWYKRILLPTLQAPLYAFRIYIDGIAHVVLPLVNQFGAQASNYESNFITAVIYAMQVQRGIDLIGSPFSTIYIDDDIVALPITMLAAEAAAFTVDTEGIAGKGAMNKKKQEMEVTLPYLSWQINVENFSLTMTLSLFLKLTCVLFLELPATISTSTTLPLKLLQRLSSYMLMAANAIPELRPFAYGAAHNTSYAHRRGTRGGRHQLCPLLRTTVVDIAMFRQFIESTLKEGGAAPLVQSIHAPPLFATLPSEVDDPTATATRQATAAHFVIHADACSPTGIQGIGFTIENRSTTLLWASSRLITFNSYLRQDGTRVPIDINLLECAAAIYAAATVARLFLDKNATTHDTFSCHESATPATGTTTPGFFTTTTRDTFSYNESATLATGTTTPKPSTTHHQVPFTHVHIFTDNTSALSWLRSFRATHPLLAFMLQTFSAIQSLSHLTFTEAHIPGIFNKRADAASRDFQVPDGPSLRLELSQFPRTPLSEIFSVAMASVSEQPLLDPSQIARLAHTVAASMLSSTSPPHTIFP
jgi:hypothetical protein